MAGNDEAGRIERDSNDIASAAKDIEEQEKGIVADDAEDAEIAREMDVLAHKREAERADAASRREHQRDDDRIIDDRSRDLKDVFGGGAGQQPSPPAPAPTPPAPGTPGAPNSGPIAGPGGPPVVPPRRVG